MDWRSVDVSSSSFVSSSSLMFTGSRRVARRSGEAKTVDNVEGGGGTGGARAVSFPVSNSSELGTSRNSSGS